MQKLQHFAEQILPRAPHQEKVNWTSSPMLVFFLSLDERKVLSVVTRVLLLQEAVYPFGLAGAERRWPENLGRAFFWGEGVGGRKRFRERRQALWRLPCRQPVSFP